MGWGEELGAVGSWGWCWGQEPAGARVFLGPWAGSWELGSWGGAGEEIYLELWFVQGCRTFKVFVIQDVTINFRIESKGRKGTDYY